MTQADYQGVRYGQDALSIGTEKVEPIQMVLVRALELMHELFARLDDFEGLPSQAQQPAPVPVTPGVGSLAQMLDGATHEAVMRVNRLLARVGRL